jgi:Tol biopolymer transport system component/C-terminal processing protease CtpA/Prc
MRQLAVLALLLPAAFAQPAAPYLTEPSVAPNRAEIAFVSGGDIWTAPLSGGEAHLLVSHPANETRPIFSPDGTRLAFVSNRTGNGDLYVLNLGTGALRRITFDDAAEQLDAWSRDGRYLYFSSPAQDVGSMNDIFRISAEGGIPVAVSADRYVNEFFSAPSPDGNALAFTARGNTSSQWWRHGHSHLDESEIWLASFTGVPKYEKLAGGDFKCLWPMWSADGSRVWFMSDQGGAENLWEKSVKGGAPRQVTQFHDGRVLWPSISYDGKTIVFERNFGIWKLDTATGKSAPIEIALRGATGTPEVNHLSLTSQFRDLALAPDGRKLAFTAHGEVFAASARDAGAAARITRTAAAENHIAWSPDSRRMVYVSDRDGAYRLYLHDLAGNTEARLTTGAGAETAPLWSGDGKLLAFVRDGKQLCVYDAATRQVRTLADGRFPRPPFGGNRFYAWSPDNQWIAYLSTGDRSFENVFVVPAAAGTQRQITFLANTNGGTVLWSPDGTYLLFDTNQRTENNNIARIELALKTPPFREDRFRDLFRDPPPPGPRTDARPAAAERPPVKPVEIVFDGIRNRLSMLQTGLDARLQQISPDGKTLLIAASAARQQNLYTFPLDELATEPPVARQATSTAGAKSGAQFSPDGREVYYLEQGRIMIATIETRVSRPLAVTAEMDVDFELEKSEVFAEAWRYLNDNFFDAQFNGVDWNVVRERFAPHVAAARTPDELRRVLSLMLGELNASHMGIAAPVAGASDGPPRGTVGKLGLRFDAAEYLSTGKLRVTEAIPLGPAAVAGSIGTGDYLSAVDGAAIAPHTNLDELLDHKVDRRVSLTIAGTAATREVAVRPVSLQAEKELVYRQWVDQQRAYVAKVSGGRLGYVHIRDMSAQALDQLYLDLDSENQGREGVVVDVRNNNGGFVNVYAIDVLARQSYLKMTERDATPAPARAVLGQRALERPTILVTNRHSLSDAEDFTEGYRFLKLGKVVGEPTAGWIVYTGNTTLIDGSTLRLPGTRVTTASGAPMEMHPRPVNIAVDKPVGETGRDSQLDAAVRELLKQIDTQK